MQDDKKNGAQTIQHPFNTPGNGQVTDYQKVISHPFPTPRTYEGKLYYGAVDVAKIIGVEKRTVTYWHEKGLFLADACAHDGRYLYEIERVEQLKSVYHPDWKRGGYQSSPTTSDYRQERRWTTNAINSAKEQLHRVSAAEIEAHNLITRTKHGYICPFCNNGAGNDGTGMEPRIGRNGQEFLCGKDGDTHDIIDIIAAHYNLDPVKDFIRVLEIGCELFNVSVVGDNAVSDRQPLARDFQVDEPDPKYLARIQRNIETAHKNLPKFLDAQPDRQYRGLDAATLDDFYCGYLSDYYARKDAPLSRRFIVPYSREHFLARLVDSKDNYRVPDGVRFNEKEHTASPKTIFNFKRALLKSDDTVCFVVEGEFDALSVAQVGRKVVDGKHIYAVNCIAIAGTKLSDTMKQQLKSLPPKKFLVMLDNDDAGIKSAPILAATFKSLGHQAAVVNLSEQYNDANDFLRADLDAFTFRIAELREQADSLFDDAVVTPPFAPPAGVNSADKYAPLFEGLRPIKISAGAILNVAKPDLKPALEVLFAEKNFISFVMKIAPTKKDSDTSDPALVYETPFGNSEVSAGQVQSALKWLIGKLYPFFGGNDSSLRNFLIDRLNEAKAIDAVKIIADQDFFADATDLAKKHTAGNFFHFDDKIKRELIAFAEHSPEIFDSLVRFDYRRLENFLERDFTDLVCAELLVDVQQKFLRFDVEQATWYVWNKNHWQAVNVKSKALLYDLWTPLARKARVFAEFERLKAFCELDDFEICNTIKDKKSPEAETLGRLKKASKKFETKFKAAANLEQSRAIEGFFEQVSGLPEIKIRTEQLDSNKFLFNCANCTIDLMTSKTYPARQDDLITLATSTVYNPNAHSGDWDNFIATAIPNDELRDWFQRFCGYCLSGSTAEDIFVFLYGIGGSGKTTLLNAIGGAFGNYAKIFPVDMITENSKQRDGNEPNPMLAALRSCRFARSSETKRNCRLAEDVIKRLTGKDPLVARELNKPPFEFIPNFKVFIDGNYLLNINDVNDLGIRRRMRIVPLDYPPPPDKLDTQLSDKLATPYCRSAILNWLLDGWRAYHKRGLRDIPTVMQTALEQFQADNDYMSEFFEAHNYCIGDKSQSKFQMPVTAVYRIYNEWRKITPRIPALKRSEFEKAVLQCLHNDGVEVAQRHKQNYFLGFAIDSTPNEFPPDLEDDPMYKEP